MRVAWCLGLWAVCCAAGVAVAQSPDLAAVSCRVLVPDGGAAGGGQSLLCGSGTAVGPRAVLTNAHVVGGVCDRPAVCVTGVGRRLAGRVVAVHPANDLALIWLDEVVEFAPLAESISRGSAVRVYGFGSQGVLCPRSGSVGGVGRFLTGGVPVVELTCLVEQGDSGSGVFDESGALGAVVWGGDPAGHAVSVAEFVQWLPEIERHVGLVGCRRQRGAGEGPCGPVAPGRILCPAQAGAPAGIQAQAPAQHATGAGLAEIRQRVEALERRGCPPGPAGPAGAAGRDGADGVSPSIDALARAVLAGLPSRMEQQRPPGAQPPAGAAFFEIRRRSFNGPDTGGRADHGTD